MLPETVTFSITLLVYGSILLLLIYYVLTLADLESDYLNAQECCSRLNFWVIPKFGIHALLCILLLLGGHWIMLLLNMPMAIWLGYELQRQPRDSLGVYDPIDIHSRGLLKVHLRNCMIYLGYYFVMFFVAMYCLISSLIKGDPIKRHEEGEFITEF
ncbi:protein cornichon homolog 4-like [Bactrocera dorsalis]|uniref:Protein cornichon homolog 4 n=1 Tax=Bactrocera dorsalis TaxID=27457 RepID=A0A6I9URC0_BACDO|nr:protein cornichon homolog 4 [Bactrocera dorsalis]XP_049302792.1 protein cornichon homolog 4-like [Bactrocera dorsalis]